MTRFFLKPFIGLFVVLSCLSSSVYAVDGSSASSGTVVVAAMESVGYHAQNQLLTSLNTMFGDLGALIYLGVVVSALLTVGLMGRYQAALWLLLGPPIFIYVSGVELNGLKNRISAQGPEWQMGPFKGPDGVKEQVMGRQDTPTEVSFVFHKYNELISEIYQLLIEKIMAEDAKKAILFMARQRMVEGIFSFDLTTPGGKSMGAYFFQRCAQQIHYARLIGKGKRDTAYQGTAPYNKAKQEYCDNFDTKKFNLETENVDLAEYARGLTPPYEHGPVSCLQLWNWFRQSATRDFAAQSENLTNNIVGAEAASVEGAASIEKIHDDAKDKITTPADGAGTSGDDPCPFPSDSSDDAMGGAGESMKVLGNIFSALMIRKNSTIDSASTSFQGILGGDMSGVVPSSDASSNRRATSLQGMDDVLRSQNAQTMAVSKQFEAFTLLMLIPYFQGMILYVLSVTYPFFALTILVPGQASSFFNWMALWAWAKSWDVGFAMVMVIDNLLWEILPKTTFFETNAVGKYTPVDLLAMHYSGDYSYSISMYWLIVSALIGAVPFITAEAILGSKKAVAGAFMGGLSDISSKLTKTVEDYHSTQKVGQILIGRAQGDMFSLRGHGVAAFQGLDKLDKGVKNASSEDAYQHNLNHLTNAASAAKTAISNVTGIGESQDNSGALEATKNTAADQFPATKPKE